MEGRRIGCDDKSNSLSTGFKAPATKSSGTPYYSPIAGSFSTAFPKVFLFLLFRKIKKQELIFSCFKFIPVTDVGLNAEDGAGGHVIDSYIT